jgi:plastocyanin
VAKVPLPADGQGSPIIDSLQPVSWEQGEPGRPIVIEAAPGLQFSPRVLTATAGERLSLTFDNPDVIPHNWVLGTRGSTSQLFALANQFIADPRAYAMHYVPPTPDILVYTRLVEPAATTSIHFNAPAEPGDYPYLCTFPGHAAIMRGVLQVR